MRQIFPGIRNICTIPIDQLPEDMAERNMVGLPITIIGDIIEVSFAGEPSCESTKDYRNNGAIYKTELKFVSTEKIQTRQHLAFIVTDVYGNDNIIGTREKPYPTIKAKRLFGKPDSRAGYEYEVSLTSVCGILPCVT